MKKRPFKEKLRSLLAGKGEAEQRKVIRALATVPPSDDDHLHWWVKTYAGVDIPRVAVCTDHVAPFQAFADAYFARSPIIIVEGSRGFSGKSFMESVLGYTEMVTLATNIRILGGSGEQAQRINAYLRNEDPNSRGKLWESPLAPRSLLASSTKTELRTTNGGYVKALMASSTSARGAHPVRLRIDEADEMPLWLYDAAMGQTMGQYGVAAQTLVTSTHHYPDGTMTEIKKRAAEQGFPVYKWCFLESQKPHGWLDPEEVERKKREVPEEMFRNEYELQEPVPEGRVFSWAALDNLFDPALGTFEGEVGEICRVVKPGAEDAEFYTGADFAKKRDFTVLHTMKKSYDGPDILACWQRLNDMPYNLMVGKMNSQIGEYGGSSAHDATGIGSVIEDYMTVRSEGVDFSRRKLITDMLSSYVAACEAGELVYPVIKPLYRAHKYLTRDQLYGSAHLPDEIAAAALAWHARKMHAFKLYAFTL